MSRRNLAVLLSFVVLGGCTPLGAWIYDDPQVVFSRLTVRPGNQSGLPYDLVLTVYNCNDYDLTGTTLDLSLSAAGSPLSKVTYTDAFTIRNLETTNLTIPLALSPDSESGFWSALEVAGDNVELVGQLTLNTPIGPRRVRFGRRGSLAVSAMDRTPLANAVRFTPGYGHFCQRRHLGPDDPFARAGNPLPQW